MDFFLPFFPLGLVVYPNENLNLHIFEPRYRELINECFENDSTFGIPTYLNNKLPGFGTEMRIMEISKRHEDGRLDIKTEGLAVFKILTFANPIKGKLYAGGKVAFMESVNSSTLPTTELVQLVDELQVLLKMEFPYDAYMPFFSYQIAHKIGLSLEEEYKLLTMSDEALRQDFISKHLNKLVLTLANVEKTKDRIKMNGHFKNLDPLNF